MLHKLFQVTEMKERSLTNLLKLESVWITMVPKPDRNGIRKEPFLINFAREYSYKNPKQNINKQNQGMHETDKVYPRKINPLKVITVVIASVNAGKQIIKFNIHDLKRNLNRARREYP